VLKALTPLLGKLDATDVVLKRMSSVLSQKLAIRKQQSSIKLNEVDSMSDMDNCLFAVSNLLKGSTANSKHFI
jgi:hypothetical protein